MWNILFSRKLHFLFVAWIVKTAILLMIIEKNTAKNSRNFFHPPEGEGENCIDKIGCNSGWHHWIQLSNIDSEGKTCMLYSFSKNNMWYCQIDSNLELPVESNRLGKSIWASTSHSECAIIYFQPIICLTVNHCFYTRLTDDGKIATTLVPCAQAAHLQRGWHLYEHVFKCSS